MRSTLTTQKVIRLTSILMLLLGSINAHAQKSVISANQLSLWRGINSACIGRTVQFIGLCTPTAFIIGDSVIKKIDFGDGTSWVQASRPTSAMDVYVDSPYHSYTFPGVYLPKYYCEIYSKGSDSLTGLTYAGPVITVKDSCAEITGTVYFDDNGNCTPNATENGLSGTIISAIDGTTGDTNAVAFTQWNGTYNGVVAAGGVSIYPGSSAPFKMPGSTPADSVFGLCPASGKTSLTVTPGSRTTVNFGAGCLPATKLDLLPYASSCTSVRGDTGVVRIYAGTLTADNLSTCASKTISLSYTLNPKQHYCGMLYGGSPSISGKVLTWNLSASMRELNLFALEIAVSTDTGAHLGDTLCSTVTIDVPPGFTDPDLTNNTYNLCSIVKSSFDPNIKDVSPRGEGTPGYISRNQRLTYTIHFQNTGTAPAKVVSILDTIDKNLDVTSMRILGQSHNMKPYISGKVVKFLFEGINLPDSGSNFMGSMGSVTYSILPKKNIGVGVPIRNKAAIYFDYNAPVITNTTLNTTYIPTQIKEETEVSNALAFPNPFGDQLTVQDLNPTDDVVLYNMQGIRLKVPAAGQILDTRSLVPGLYILEIRHIEGNAERQLVQKM